MTADQLVNSDAAKRLSNEIEHLIWEHVRQLAEESDASLGDALVVITARTATYLGALCGVNNQQTLLEALIRYMVDGYNLKAENPIPIDSL